jgi:hypothetical protein
MGMKDLLALFGAAMVAKLRQPAHRSQTRGKRYRTRGSGGPHHPARTKLVRQFIRRSRLESTYWRTLYASMTGHQYKGFSL